MASSLSQPLHNFRLPPWSSLTATANFTALPVNAAATGSISRPSDKNKPPETSKDKQKTTKNYVLKLKIHDKTFKITTISSGSDCETPSELSSCSVPAARIETQPESTIVDQPEPEPKKEHIVVPAAESKKVKRGTGENRCFSITMSRKEIEEDIMAIEKALGSRKRMRRPNKRSRELQRQLDLLCPGIDFVKRTD